MKPANQDQHPYKVCIADFPAGKEGDEPSGAQLHNENAPEQQQLRVGMLLTHLGGNHIEGIEYQQVGLGPLALTALLHLGALIQLIFCRRLYTC